MEDAMLIDLVLLIVNFGLFCNVSNLFSDLLHFCTRLVRLLLMRIKYIVQNESNVQDKDEEEEEEEEEDDSLRHECKWRNDKGEISYDDAQVVLRRLGMASLPWCEREAEGKGDSACKECEVMEGVDVLLEEKEASLKELEEAFYIFDRNEDGFISPAELWCVMRRLGLQEGVKLEDCERMIHVFDEDGDGKINFSEFRRLLENAD